MQEAIVKATMQSNCCSNNCLLKWYSTVHCAEDLQFSGDCGACVICTVLVVLQMKCTLRSGSLTGTTPLECSYTNTHWQCAQHGVDLLLLRKVICDFMRVPHNYLIWCSLRTYHFNAGIYYSLYDSAQSGSLSGLSLLLWS